jgi:hypothetical protein
VKSVKPWVVPALLVATAVAWRVVNWHYMFAPNLELVTASTLVAATFLHRRMALVVPLAIAVVGDLIIGNTPILFFTWSAFALIGLSGLLLRGLRRSRGKLMLTSVGAGVAASVFFFVYTNFGVWVLTSMYPHTWAGLVQCYVMGLPFYRTMLLGNLVFVPAYFAVAAYGPALVRRVMPAKVAAAQES